MNSIQGCSLLKKALKRWIYENQYTQPYIAKKLNISTAEFKRKLSTHEKFSKDQIEKLVHFMGAEDAFRVIYFQNIEERQRVFYETFGKHN